MTCFTTYAMRNPARVLCSKAKYRASKSGIPFSITPEDVLIPEFCPILGIKLESGRGKGKRGPRDESPSIDRIVPDLGYVKGNVQVISSLANAMKSSATPEQLLTFADWINRAYR